MEGVTILGAGGHGRDVAEVLHGCGMHVAGFLDDRTGRPWDDLAGPYVFGVHDSRTRAHRDFPNYPSPVAVHPSAYYAPEIAPWPGVVIGPRAVVGNGCRIGRHVHIGQGASLVRTTVGDYATISPGAVICGDVTIGEGATIGAGAVISNLCQIGDYSTIGAGAVLPPHTTVPVGAVWVGVPARPVHE